jgi:hypothetical protein
MRRTALAVLAGLLIALATLALPAAQAAGWTSSSYMSRLITLLDQARQQHGLPALSVASGTTQVAAAWTAHLDAAQSLSHNPDLRHQLETHGSPDWTDYGENVGRGPADDPDALFKAYMNSSEHRVNILSGAYRFMGVAVILDGDSAWNTFDFVDSYHSPAPPTTTHAKPAPKPTAHATATRAPLPISAAAPPAIVATHPPVRRVTPHAVARRPAGHPARSRPGPSPHRTPSRTVVVGGFTSGASAHAIALGPLPAPAAPTGQVPIALAGALVGFIGVRWAQVRRMSPASHAGAVRDQDPTRSLVCAGPDRPVLEVLWTGTSPLSSPPASARPSTALRRLRSPISSRPSSPPSGRAAARR